MADAGEAGLPWRRDPGVESLARPDGPACLLLEGDPARPAACPSMTPRGTGMVASSSMSASACAARRSASVAAS